MNIRPLVFFLALASAVSVPAAFSQFFLDLEGGAAFTGYNDLRIPADGGSDVSLAEDLAPDAALALRLRLGYLFRDRHSLSVLAAPLTVRGGGTPDRDILYRDKTFAAGERADFLYRFDSYRLTYRYSVVKNDSLEAAAGLTAKVRSADIALMSDSAYAHRSDLGTVPLVNLHLQWMFRDRWSLLFDADALVSPFGRAEDGLLALQYHPRPDIALRAGYRILEGGSDGGGNVYTFALFNYLTAGITVSF